MKVTSNIDLTQVHVKKFFKGLAIALVGALLTFATTNAADLDFGTYGPWLMPLYSALVNGAKLLYDAYVAQAKHNQ